MLNKLSAMLRRYAMLQPGDTLVCAVSGGADSMALLWAMYLMKDKLSIRLEAAHFNHGLRGEEALRDEQFVRDFCRDYNIPLHVGRGTVTAGDKGLEAAAREARYAYFATLSGKIATAHTADDNAETVLMRLVRGTGLKGLGGIAPVRRCIIRPMLNVTRQEVLAFLEEYSIPWVNDSSNESQQFLRNRIRHSVMPLLYRENPQISRNLSAMAMDLREDEAALTPKDLGEKLSVSRLKAMEPALRSRYLAAALTQWGVRDLQMAHIRQAEALAFSDNPSAWTCYPGNIRVGRSYDSLEKLAQPEKIRPKILPCPGELLIEEAAVRIVVTSLEPGKAPQGAVIYPEGPVTVRSREPGDTIRLSGGTKSLKKLFIDKKIPQTQRDQIPVLADSAGVLLVRGIGTAARQPSPEAIGFAVRFETVVSSEDYI